MARVFAAAVLAALAGLGFGANVQAEEAPLVLGPVQLTGDGPNYGTLGVGWFSIFHNTHKHYGAPEGVVEFKGGQKLFHFGPAAGVMANSDGGFMVYVGPYLDFRWDRVVFTPFAGFGYWHQGGSKDLGSAFEFRLSMDLAYQFDDRSRLGVRIAHISNAYTGRINPGVEEALLTYAIPFR